MKQPMIDYVQTQKFDELYTPDYALKPLLKYIPKGITVWECTDFGKSEITRLLKEHGCDVISTDKKENFFKHIPEKPFDMIITNPPYSLKNEFLKRCYEFNKPFALLLPLTTLEGVERGKLFREKTVQLLVLDKRIDFTGKKSCWFNTSWFCYKLLNQNLVFESLEK